MFENFSRVVHESCHLWMNLAFKTEPTLTFIRAYHAAGYIFRDTLSLNITQNSSSDFVNTNSDWVFTNSEISQTSLVDPVCACFSYCLNLLYEWN